MKLRKSLSRTLALALAALAVIAAACQSGGLGSTATPAAAPEIHVVTSLVTRYYAVSGSTATEIFRSLQEEGPLTADGVRAVGLTTAIPRREWEPRQDGRSCAIARLTVRLDVTITLPVLGPTSRPDAATLANWERFVDRVRVHEERHLQIYQQGFEAMRDLLAARPPSPTCEALEASIARIWQEQVAAIETRQDAFHAAEDARVAAAREPLRRQIESNKAAIAALEAEIAGLDAALNELKPRALEVEGRLVALRSEIDAIARKYPDLLIPEPDYGRYRDLRARHNDLLPAYNALIGEFNSMLSRRNDLAGRHSDLVAATNGLVEHFNWLQG
jgi:predicted secreted Zn-dependent protease